MIKRQTADSEVRSLMDEGPQRERILLWITRFRGSYFGIWVSGFGFRVSGFGFRVRSIGVGTSQSRCAPRTASTGCAASLQPGFGFRVSGFGFHVSGFGFGVSGFQLRVSGFRFREEDRGCTPSGARTRTVTCPRPVSATHPRPASTTSVHALYQTNESVCSNSTDDSVCQLAYYVN